MIDSEGFLEAVCGAVVSGGAICLLGAGFAAAGTDRDEVAIPGTSDLIHEIKKVVGLEHEDVGSLADIADYCDDRADLQLALRKLMIARLTLCKPSPVQREFASHPWRSIFTTNFDDTIESCFADGGKQVITPNSHDFTRDPNAVPIYYMHGRAKDLVESSADPKFVLSERNYLRLHEDNRELYSQLQNELFAARYIVLVGYSLRDLEVARLFIDAGHAFRSKTLIITGDSESDYSLARLEKFGTVMRIGLKGFTDALTSASGDDAKDDVFNFVDLVQNSTPTGEISSDDFIRLILTGRFEAGVYQRQLVDNTSGGEVYSIGRASALSLITDRPKSGVTRFLVSSDLGNGKSVFLRQLGARLLASGYRVAEIASGLPEAFVEIDRLLASDEPTAYLIDDVIRYRSAAEYIGKRLNAVSILVCCMRGDPGEVIYRNLSGRLGGAVKQVELNKLSLQEIEQWDLALERWGMWEQRVASPREDRIKFLAEECSSENRSIILALFKNNSEIARKIDQIVSFFLKNKGYQRAFAGLLISALCQQHVSWESIVFWLDIDEQYLREDLEKTELSELFFDGKSWNILTSTQLADHILRTKYVADDKDTLVDVYSTIVQKTADSAGDDRLGFVFRENLKELMKFRFLTRLFGDDEDGVRLISRVYSKLSKAKYIRNNPQFWLQYAMSRMEVDDLDSAERYLNTALGLAKERGMTYSPFQILDQRARLFFRKNAKSSNRLSLNEVRQAVKDLTELLGDPSGEIIYLYRSAPLINEFLEERIDEVDVSIKGSLRELLLLIKEAGEGFRSLPRAQKGETAKLKKALSDALLVLEYG